MRSHDSSDSEDSDATPSANSIHWKKYYPIRHLPILEENVQSHKSEPILTENLPTNPFTEISYRHNGNYHTLKLPFDNVLSRLTSIEGLFPENTWIDMLNDSERSHLKQFLPQLNGWNTLSEDAATAENLRALFRGENFDFGNPISQLNASIAKGTQSKAHLLQRSCERAENEIKSIEKLKKPIEALVKRIKAQDPAAARFVEMQSSDHDVEQFPWKRRRILIESPVSPVTEENSLFIAIRDILSASPTEMSYEDLLSKLSTSYARALPKKEDLFSYLDIGRYIKSALTFLQNPLRHVQELKQAETMIWTQQFVQIDQDKQTYEWAHKQSDSKENSCLMSLEQYFRIPMAENLEVCGSKRSAIQRMRREISKLHRPIAVRKLQERYPQALKDMEAPPSSIFRLDLIPRHSHVIWDLKDFHRQELERHSAPGASFSYKHSHTDTTYTVGPCLTKRALFDGKMLVPGAPLVVSFLGLVYEAIARLPEGTGSRADIMNFVRHSQFVRLNISNVDLNYAVVETLDLLVVETPPLLMYDAERRVWIYIPPAPDSKSDERIEMSKLSSVDEKPLKTENVSVTSLQNLLF